jgi:hypothetical protein
MFTYKEEVEDEEKAIENSVSHEMKNISDKFAFGLFHKIVK